MRRTIKAPILVSLAMYAFALVLGGPAAAGQIFWIEGRAIARANLDGRFVQPVLSSAEAEQAISLAVDPVADRVYYGSASFPFPIKSVGYDGSGDVEMIGGSSDSGASGIAVDPVGGKLYFTVISDCDGCGRIMRADLDGSNVGFFHPAGGPHAIEVSHDLNSLWWTEGYLGTSGPALSGSIETSDLTGSAPNELISIGKAKGLAVDPIEGKIYWTDHELNVIRRANLDGTGVEDLVTAGLEFPWGLALDREAGKIYWTEHLAGTIHRANLDGSDAEELLFGRGRLRDIEVDSTFTPTGSAFCEDPNGSCDLGLCEAFNSCNSNDDCTGYTVCMQFAPCTSSACSCEPDGSWTCNDDCAPQCVTPATIPTLSIRGVVVLGLLLLGLGALRFR